MGGVEKVFHNLCISFSRLGIKFRVNPPVSERTSADANILLGRGIQSLKAFDNGDPFIAAIGISSHPKEFPDLPEKYNIKAYLSHCDWINQICKSYWGNICDTWPAGIDTDYWKPDVSVSPDIDILIYKKFGFEKELDEARVYRPLMEVIQKKGFSYAEITYGNYKEKDFFDLLKKTKSMLFLSQHETQGIACNQVMSMNIPVLAWDEHRMRDPYYTRESQGNIYTESVPFFDQRCGLVFEHVDEFEQKLDTFMEHMHAGTYTPRAYVLENVSMEKSAARMLELIRTYLPQAEIPEYPGAAAIV